MRLRGRCGQIHDPTQFLFSFFLAPAATRLRISKVDECGVNAESGHLKRAAGQSLAPSQSAYLPVHTLQWPTCPPACLPTTVYMSVPVRPHRYVLCGGASSVILPLYTQSHSHTGSTGIV